MSRDAGRAGRAGNGPPGALHWRSIGGNNPDSIGGNTHLYHSADSAILVDLGVGYGAAHCNGYERALPDITGLLPPAAGPPPPGPPPRIQALLVTHGHGDHIGGIAPLVDYVRRNRLPVTVPPIYGSALAITLVEQSLAAARLPADCWPERHVVAPGERLQFGALGVTALGASHSIPGAYALAIETDSVRHFHSGDIKADQTVAVGPRTDLAALRALAGDDKGFTSMVLESTRADHSGRTPSMRAVGQAYGAQFDAHPGKRAVIGVQAANLEEIVTIATAAVARGKHLVWAGASVGRMLSAAKLAGLDLGQVIADRVRRQGIAVDAEAVRFHNIKSKAVEGFTHRDQVVFTAGASGMGFGTLSRVAHGEDSHMSLSRRRDYVIVAGSARQAAGMINTLREDGIQVVTEADTLVHASGHGHAQDLALIADAVDPAVVMPIHGDLRLLQAHAELHRAAGRAALVVDNGAEVTIAAGAPPQVTRVAAVEDWIGMEPSRARRREGLPVTYHRYQKAPFLALEGGAAASPAAPAPAAQAAGSGAPAASRRSVWAQDAATAAPAATITTPARR